MITAVQLAGVASLLSALQGTLGAGVGTRSGARNGYERPGTAYDVDVMPGMGLSLSEGRFTLSLGYGPLFSMRDVDRSDRVLVTLHSGYLSAGYSGRGYSLSLSQSASIGEFAFRGLRTTPIDPRMMPSPTAPRVDPVPANQVVRIFNESTTGQFTYAWDPRLSSGLGASYSIGGGYGPAEQLTLPRIRTASSDLSTTYQLTPSDRFGTSVGLANIRTSGGTFVTAPMGPTTAAPNYTYWTLILSLSWNHRFSRTTSGSLSMGGYGYSTSVVGRTRLYSLALTGSGSFDAELVRSGRLVISTGIGGTVGPAISPLSAEFQQRVQGTGRLSAGYDRVSLTISGDGSQTFPVDSPQAFRMIGGGASLGYAPYPLIDFAVEYRTMWQSTYLSPVSRVWVAFLNISMRAPPLRF